MLGKIWIIAAMLLLISGVTSAQYGYGTSSITLSRYSITMVNGGTANVNYSVNLASGSTWGTTLSVTDNNYLLSEGIGTSLSKYMGNPTYSGVLSLTVSPSTPKGTYSVTLQATGDDPSAHNTTLVLTIAPPNSSTTSVVVPGNNASSTIAPTVAPTTIVTTVPPHMIASPANALTLELIAGILITLIVSIALMFVFAGGHGARYVVWGIALIIIGTLLWLYGDYNGYLLAYIWSGVGLIALGIIIWAAADAAAGAYKSMEVSTLLDIAGIILLIVGTIIWILGDYYYAGNLIYIWSGVGIMALGTVIWIIGNAIGGTFKGLRTGRRSSSYNKQ